MKTIGRPNSFGKYWRLLSWGIPFRIFRILALVASVLSTALFFQILSIKFVLASPVPQCRDALRSGAVVVSETNSIKGGRAMGGAQKDAPFSLSVGNQNLKGNLTIGGGYSGEESQVIKDLVALILSGQQAGWSHYRPEIVRSLLKEKQIELERKVGVATTRAIFLEVQRQVSSWLSGEQDKANSAVVGDRRVAGNGFKIKVLQPIKIKEFSHFAGFSLDGKYILTAAGDTAVKLWSVVNASMVHSFARLEKRIRSANFSPDGKYIVTVSYGRIAKLWDVSSDTMVHSFDRHTDWVRSAEFSPDGKYVVTASDDKTAKLWDVASGAMVHSFDGHTNRIRSAEFSPDGRYVVTASYDKTVKLWDVTSGTMVYSFPEFTVSAKFSPDGKYIATASYDTTAKLWEVANGNLNLVHSFEGHWLAVEQAVFSPDGKYVLTASADMTAKLWDVVSGTLVHSFEGHADFVRSVAFSPDGKYVSTSAGIAAKLWDVATGALVHSFEGHAALVRPVAFSPDGKYMLTASRDGTAKLWSLYQELDPSDISIENVSEGGIHD